MNTNKQLESSIEENEHVNAIAIIGMAGRFPQAQNIDEFWNNLRGGIECIAYYANEDLTAAGISAEALKHPDYVKAKGEVDNVDMFDASFFGINPREAEVTDPQHRMLLECAWEAMEHAGYDSSKYTGSIGVFAGKSMDYYLLLNVYPRIKREISAGSLQAAIGNDKDSLTTTISYRLNLTGPAITVQTSSSTSLVSVCVACQSLLTYQCDVALAGGITAGPPIKSGYLFQEGNIWADDGHCRPFDARAKGFIPGSGMGLVVLKRLEDALLDGDQIWAVIKGFAVNNDGNQKVSYSAPSVDAQSEVVAEALAVADVHPETIQYIETHGTGTNLGDPIEVTALTQAFQNQTAKKHFCAIGSVKSNIGHLDNAAGIAGLIKTSLSLKYRQIPPSLHFEKPNPKIDWENCPFYVNTGLKEWAPNTNAKGKPIPRRAGITSLGMGGTNAHVILEEAPPLKPSGESREWQLILLSAKSATALDTITAHLQTQINLGVKDDFTLPNLAYTSKIGRRDFNNRRLVLCHTMEEAAEALEKQTPGRLWDSSCDMVERPVIFMFSGQGAQYIDMAKELYQKEPIFKANIDRCTEMLLPFLGLNLREMLYPENKEKGKKNSELLQQTRYTQPLLFMLEYSLAQLLMEWGIVPKAMIGHSIGEFVAACLAGCMELEDALKLVSLRGKLMYEQEPGTMLSIGLDETRVTEILGEELSLAAVNSPRHCVVSGSTTAIEQLEKRLSDEKVFHRRLHTSHAFHSYMMEPALEKFTREVSRVEINPPAIPFISCLTGTWISAEEGCSPQYWANQLRQTVRFSQGISEILKQDHQAVLLEVGPGDTLCLMAREHHNPVTNTQPLIFSTIRHVKQTEADMFVLFRTLGNLWLSGVNIDWQGFYKHETRRRIPLPTYPFERKRYWLDEVKEFAAGLEPNRGEKPSARKEGSIKTQAIPEEASSDLIPKEEKIFQPRPQLPNEYMAPTNKIQEEIIEMWEDLLGIKPIGITDNFFDLGGHSLLATLFLSQVQEHYQIRLEMRVIFEDPTIECIAREVAALKPEASEQEKIEELLKEVENRDNTISSDRSDREEDKAFHLRPALPNEYTPPVDEIEQEIVEMWEDILGIKPVGIHDNFFDLGGHSLLATLFLSQLQERYQIRLEMRVIFEEPTIACIADQVKAQENKAVEHEKIEDLLKEVEEGK